MLTLMPLFDRRMLKVERNQLVASILLCLFAIAYLWGALLLPLGSLSQPEAGLFPTAIGCFLFLLALIHLVQTLNKKSQEWKGENFPKGKDFRRVMGISLILIFYGTFWDTLGYILLSIFLMVGVLRLLGMHNWWKILLFSIAVSGVSYYLFNVILNIPFSKGIFFPG
jgi:putative tricarboxylic transport membrane protein